VVLKSHALVLAAHRYEALNKQDCKEIINYKMTGMKNIKTRQFIHGIILVCGLVLMIGGIITGKHGATVGGIIVAGVNVQQWIQWHQKNKKESND